MKKSCRVDVDCANCANKMELAAKKTPGVKDAVVNFMALKMSVEFADGADPKAVMMNKAEKIMKKKAVIKAELDKALPKAQSDALWQKATTKLDGLMTRYGDLPKGVHMHTDSRILPSAAIYLTAKEAIGPEKAYRVIEDAAIRGCAEIEKKLQKVMRLPGMQSLFVKAWDPMTKKLFGAGNGFQNVFYTKKKGEYRMDVTSCPYCRTFTELGCPELTKIFCENDERIYGRLPGLKFERTGTLGKGAERCDFCLRKV